MMKRLLEVLIVILVAVAGFFAVYLRQMPPSVQHTQEQNKQMPLPDEDEQLAAPTEKRGSFSVGILGESLSENPKPLPFNQDVLTQLFEVLNERDVRAVFFTGNLVFGWSPIEPRAIKTDQKKEISRFKPLSKQGLASHFTYNQTAFDEQLKQFSSLVHASFNRSVAFYPLIGTRESIGAGTLDVFIKNFNLKNQMPPSAVDRLGYTVSIEDSLFVIIPTNYYDTKKQQIIEHAIDSDALAWLEDVLKAGRENHRYLFVLGHEPAYSTPSMFNHAVGLDNHPEQRDAFWGVLKKYGVLAYFASHEHMYDRSNRDGIWQVISGGGGSPLGGGDNGNRAFFHCLLLTIPEDSEDKPSVTVLDLEGNILDYFELTQEKQALYQFRIS